MDDSRRKAESSWKGEAARIQLLIMLLVSTSVLFAIMVPWLPEIPVADASVTPEDLSAAGPLRGPFGRLPIVPALLGCCSVWWVLMWRRLSDSEHGYGLALCAYGLLCQTLGAYGSFHTGAAADPLIAPIGELLIYLGDAAVIGGLCAWLASTLMGIRHRLSS